MKKLERCSWAESDPLLRTYHDEEWGVPVRDSRVLWEMLMLEGFQAGLSWLTILRKREAFRAAFANFDPKHVAKFSEKDVTRLMGDAGIIRSQAKIKATIEGARIYLAMQEAGEDFSEYVWALAGGKPIRNKTGIVPAKTDLSETISAALKKRGFKFVGPVIVYAWMQAVGIVDDHVKGCFQWRK
jgi:DNA-3-methyladenine glycosylase I